MILTSILIGICHPNYFTLSIFSEICRYCKGQHYHFRDSATVAEAADPSWKVFCDQVEYEADIYAIS